MSFLHSPTNPFRPPDWRWQRAAAIAEGTGAPTTKRRDTPAGYDWIRKATRFRRAWNDDIDGSNRTEIAEQNYAIFWAHWLYMGQQPQQRASVEARILAREDDFEIGYRAGLPPAVVQAYEALFYDVREKLPHTGYMLHVVFGPSVMGSNQVEHLWRLYGYFLGPHVLNALESNFSNPNWCGTPDTVGSSVQEDAISTLKIKAAVAAKTIPVNGNTQLALLEQFTKFVEVERTTDSAGKSQEQIMDHIGAALKSMPINIAGRDPRNGTLLPKGPLDAYDSGSVELTYEEMLRVSVRMPIANAETLKLLKFPTSTPQITG